MKRNLLKILPILLLGGAIGLTAAPAAFEAVGVKAEDAIKGSQSFANTKIAGWDCNPSKLYCGSIYGGKINPAVIKNTGIEDFKVFSSGETYTLDVNVYGITNNVTDAVNKVNVSTVNSSGAIVNLGTAVEGAFNKGSNISSASKATKFAFVPGSTVTGLQIDIGARSCLVKVSWTITKGGVTPPTPSGETYTLVTDPDSLTAGDIIVLASSDNGVVAGEFNTKYLKTVSAAFNTDENTVICNEANEITLTGTSGEWKLATSEGQIVAGDSGSISFGKDGTAWDIVDSDGVLKITDGLGSILYNSGAPRFTYYTTAQTDIEIYKKSTKAESYSVSYNSNGGEGEMSDASSPYISGSSVSVLENSFSAPLSKEFSHWNTKADDTGTSYDAGDTFSISENTTLYAIWDEVYIPTGDSYQLVTEGSALSLSDNYLFVYRSGETVKVNGGLEGRDYMTCYDAKIVDDELTYSSESVVPFKLEGSEGAYKIVLSNKYLEVTADSTNKLATKSTSSQTWDITIDSSNYVHAVSSFNNLGYEIQYNNRFSNYKGTMNDVYLYRKSGVTKSVTLSEDEIDGNVGDIVTLSIIEATFTPSTYSWAIIEGDENVSFTSGTTSDSVTLSLDNEGTAKVYLTVDDSVHAEASITIHDYKYTILDGSDYFISTTSNKGIMAYDISNITDPDFTDSSNQWHFEEAYEGDNSYYLINKDNKYLTYNRDIEGHEGDSKESLIVLWDEPISVWTVSLNDTDYMLSTLTKKGKNRSLSQNADDNKWYAFEGNHYVNLMEGGTYDHYSVDKLPTKTVYYVGEKFNPLNMKVNAYYTNGYSTDITKLITWDLIAKGTKATGKFTLGGVEYDVECEGITILSAIEGSLVADGIKDTYYIGEKVSNSITEVRVSYLIDGEEQEKPLLKAQYVVTPDVISEGLTSVRVSMVEEPEVYKDYEINAVQNHFVSANYLGDGDVITIGTLGCTPYEITGGEEFTYDGTKFGHSSFGYMPYGQQKFEVSKEGSYYALKNVDNGLYLRGDSSSFKAYSHIKENDVYPDLNGIYTINLNVTLGGQSFDVDLKTKSTTKELTDYGAFEGYKYTGSAYLYAYSDLENDKIDFSYFPIAGGEDYATVELNWRLDGGAFVYTRKDAKVEDPLNDEALWSMNYDVDTTSWNMSCKAYPDKQCYYNNGSAGKFGFYSSSEIISTQYFNIMVFRDNTKPVPGTISGVSVGFNTYLDGEGNEVAMNTVSVGEPFAWTSSLIVTVYYEGGAFKEVPIGGYQIDLPDTSKVGKSKGKIYFGQEGHQIEKEFEIFVTGHTSAFDVVCKDPILVGETYQAHFEDHYEPPEGEPIKWSVSDPALASIDQNGNVTGLKPGYVDVIATSFDGFYSNFEHVQIFQNVISLSLDKPEMTLEEGATSTIVPTVLPSDASNPDVTWSSEDPNIASVNSKGEVTGLSVGTTTITCITEGKPFGAEEPLTATCKVTVTPGSVVRVDGVSLDCKYKELKPGDTFQLNAIVSPTNATNKNVTWESDNPKLADVKNGKVTVKASASTGKTVYITVKTEDGDFIDKCEIKIKASVQPVPVTSISFDITSKNIDIDETFEIVATVNPENADDKGHIDWESSDDSVAQIISVGPSSATIIGFAEGSAIITATCGGKTATCEVTVGDQPTPPTPISVESVSLDKSSINLAPNGTYTLTATVNPSDADNKNVSWSSSDTSVATVSQSGEVTAIKAGEAIITVTSEDGNKTATCLVTVTSTPTPVVNVDSVAIQKDGKAVSEVSIDLNANIDLTAIVNPDNATNKNVTWSSSDSKVVTVDSNGHVTGIAAGEATITVKSQDGGKTATCTIKVVDRQAQTKTNIIILSSAGGVAVVGIGCGVGIPLTIRARKRKLLKK